MAGTILKGFRPCQFLLPAAFLQPGDEVLLPDPIYDAYAGPIALWGGRPISISSTIADGRFTFDRAALEKAYSSRARLILINTPWNPTGTVLRPDEMQTLIEFAGEKNLAVISDDIYETLVYDGKRHVSVPTLTTEARARSLHVHIPSQTYTMT